MADAKGIFALVQNLIEDKYATIATFENFQPVLNGHYRRLYRKLAETDFPFDVQQVVVPAIPPGTRDLSAYISSGQLLELLNQPQKMWWKQAATDDTNYVEIFNVDELPDVMNVQGPEAWKYAAMVVYLTPSTIAYDLRIEGDFFFPPLKSEGDPIRIGGMDDILAGWIAGTIGIMRGNERWQAYALEADDQLDLVTRKWVKDAQSVIRRFGRMTRRGRGHRRISFR